MATSVTLPDYITKTSEEIHKEILDNAPENINTIEGDIFWNATKPMAEESARIRNIALNNIIYSHFPQTATGEYLILIGKENGVTKKEADYSIQSIKFVGMEGTIIEKDRVVSTESSENVSGVEFTLNETVTIPTSGEVNVNATCTVAGTIGNVALGNITILAKSLNGITSLENIKIVKYGIDAEDDETYRERILEKMQKPITSGNKYQYEEWAKEVSGVGSARCVTGAGNVKVIITDSNSKAATEELIQNVYEYIDSIRPVLAGTLTIISAVEKTINITANINLVQGYNLGTAQNDFEVLASEYLKTIKLNSKTNNVQRYVSIAKIGNFLLNTSGILDYTELKINDGTSNILLEDEEIAVIGSVTLGVI